MKYLLIDYGATAIKAAVIDFIDGQIKMIEKYPSPKPFYNEGLRNEISVKELKSSFLTICNKYYNEYNIKYEGISISSQMHGFIILDKLREPKTNYISWKDERSLEILNGISTFNYYSEILSGRFKDITGMTPRPGIPFFNILHIAKEKGIRDNDIIITLPTLLASVSGNFNLIEHDTMLAGLGFYDIIQKKISKDLQHFFYGNTKVKIKHCEKAELGETSGFLNLNNTNIPIYLGVGDHQCALLGAKVLNENDVSINLGTGSQVSRVRNYIKDKMNADKLDYRPYFNGKYLETITHIPSGRALDEFIYLLGDIIHNTSDNNYDPWEIVRTLTDNEIINSTLKIDLSLFKSAWNYKTGGKIENIEFGNFRLRNFLGSLMRSYIYQYIKASQILVNCDKEFNYIFSGGIARRLPYIPRLFSKVTRCKTINAKNYDETLLGLSTISLINSKLEDNCIKAVDHKYN